MNIDMEVTFLKLLKSDGTAWVSGKLGGIVASAYGGLSITHSNVVVKEVGEESVDKRRTGTIRGGLVGYYSDTASVEENRVLNITDTNIHVDFMDVGQSSDYQGGVIGGIYSNHGSLATFNFAQITVSGQMQINGKYNVSSGLIGHVQGNSSSIHVKKMNIRGGRIDS